MPFFPNAEKSIGSSQDSHKSPFRDCDFAFTFFPPTAWPCFSLSRSISTRQHQFHQGTMFYEPQFVSICYQMQYIDLLKIIGFLPCHCGSKLLRKVSLYGSKPGKKITSIFVKKESFVPHEKTDSLKIFSPTMHIVKMMKKIIMICDLVYLLKSLHQTCLPITVTLSLANGLCPNIWTLPSLHARGRYKRKFVYPEMHQSKPKVYHCNIAEKNRSYTVFEKNQNCLIWTFRSISYFSWLSNIWIFVPKYT